MTARNNTFLHSLNPEIFKKWIFFSSSVKGILTCCIMHNFPQVITNIKTKKKITHSDCTQTSFLNRIQLFSVYRNKWHVSVTISNTDTWCSLCWKKSSQISEVFRAHENRFIRKKNIALVLISSKDFLVVKQSLGTLGSYVLINPQQHLFLGNSIYKYFRELGVHKAETYCLTDSFRCHWTHQTLS